MGFLQNLSGRFLKIPGFSYFISSNDFGATPNGDVKPEQTSIIHLCCKILSDNLSRMPVSIYSQKNGKEEQRNHYLYSLLRFQPNAIQNAQTFFSTLEYYRNKTGNAFARIRRNKATGRVTSLEIVPPENITKVTTNRGKLFYHVDYRLNDLSKSQRIEPVNADDMLHFKAMGNGLVGFSPLEFAANNAQVYGQGTETVKHFYKNKATPAVIVESNVPSGAKNKESLMESQESFSESIGGSRNAGKALFAPLGSTVKPFDTKFTDAQMLEILKFTRDEIANLYCIPSYMVSGESDKISDIEGQTRSFKTFSIAPITHIYRAEMESKLLLESERVAGVTIEFDLDSLVEMDIKTKVQAVKDQVVNGLMTHNEGIAKLGNKPIEGAGNLHYIQSQWVDLETQKNVVEENNKKNDTEKN